MQSCTIKINFFREFCNFTSVIIGKCDCDNKKRPSGEKSNRQYIVNPVLKGTFSVTVTNYVRGFVQGSRKVL